MESMTIATDTFVTEADYLTESDSAAVAALRQAAAGYDDKGTAALLTLWFKIYSSLRIRKQDAQPVDPDEAALREFDL